MSYVSIGDFGARAATGSGRCMNISGTSLTLQAPGDFVDGDHVVVLGAGPAHSLPTPPAPTLSIGGPLGKLSTVGAGGTTVRDYAVVAMTESFGWSAASPIATIRNSPDALSVDNWVRVSVGPPPSNVYQYVVYTRIQGQAWEIAGGFIANSPITIAKQFCDFGYRPSGVPNFTLPVSSLPTASQNDVLRTTIISGGGTTSLRLADVASAMVSNVRVDHDNLVPILAALSASAFVCVPPGTWRCWGNVEVNAAKRISGEGIPWSVLEFAAGYGMLFDADSTDSHIKDLKIKQQVKLLPAGRMLCPSRYEGANPDTCFHGAGLAIRAEIVVEDVQVVGVYGSGFLVRASSVEGTNANRTQLIRPRASSNYGNGIHLSGQDANICGIYSPNAINNFGDGLLDASFLGSSWFAGHGSGNQGRAYVARDEGTCFAVFVGCYSESGVQLPSEIRNPAVVLGGDHGARFNHAASTGLLIENRRRVSSFSVGSGDAEEQRRRVQIGGEEADGNRLWKYSVELNDYSALNHTAVFSEDVGRISYAYAGAPFGDGYWWWGGDRRNPGKIHFGDWVGVGESSLRYRRFGFSTGTPVFGGVYEKGDAFIDISGAEIFYRPTTKFGIGATWLANHDYRAGEVVYPSPADGFSYVCKAVSGSSLNAGRSGASQPTWSSAGDIIDNHVVWTRHGSATPSWEKFGRRTKRASLNFPSVGPSSTAELTVAVSGATLGDTVVATPEIPPAAGIVWNAWVSAVNQVSIRLTNVSGAAIDPAATFWNVDAFKH